MQQKNSILQFLIEKKWRWLRHVLLILVLMLNYDLFSYERCIKFSLLINVNPKAMYISLWINLIFALGLVYANLYYLFPKYFRKALYAPYFIGIIIIAILFFLMNYFTQWIFVEFYDKKADFATKISPIDFMLTVMYPIVFLLATTGFKVFTTWIADQEKLTSLQQEKLFSELQQLKNQVNPHFLFNTLNNLNVLINSDPQKASDIVLGFSDVLRYQIYDSQHETVPLKKDIEIIKQYLELEKIRRDDLTFTINCTNDINHIKVPPLLFTNFIDNAIKYSQSRNSSFVEIEFVLIDNFLHFKIINSKPTVVSMAKSNGLGLPNIKKRLDLLYGDKHTLLIEDKPNLYTVNLKIPI